jgi:type I restriction-modification system DNA methylase subunit
MGLLHDQLKATGYGVHGLRLMLVRLLFLMFADDTGLWGETGLFEDYIERKTAEDGSDLGMHLGALFEVLDKKQERRQTNLDEALAQFPYVNGSLFREPAPLASFDSEMRETLLRVCRFNWSKISPAIFGSMFQSVMKLEERRAIGAHYTTERNILKTIEPLFLDELRERLAAAGQDRLRLRELFQDLRSLQFFDPACGCGNFLVIAYRELRAIELEVLRRLQKLDRKVREGQLSADVSLLSHVDVDQFYGIEYEEFPARIAEVAMYLIDHLANQELSQEFGLSYARIPLHTPANVRVGNATRIDWSEVLPAEDCSYLLGNPPFVAKKRRSPEQVEDMEIVFGGRTVLDYVATWFAKASVYVKGTQIRAAFVATNSIVQGEQVPALWPRLLEEGMKIDFAHRSFRWMSSPVQ